MQLVDRDRRRRTDGELPLWLFRSRGEAEKRNGAMGKRTVLIEKESRRGISRKAGEGEGGGSGLGKKWTALRREFHVNRINRRRGRIKERKREKDVTLPLLVIDGKSAAGRNRIKPAG